MFQATVKFYLWIKFNRFVDAINYLRNKHEVTKLLVVKTLLAFLILPATPLPEHSELAPWVYWRLLNPMLIGKIVFILLLR
jgi:hypothetical protein